MITSLIVAIDQNNGIGKNGDLLWHLPKDMAFFKRTTLGHPIITGRKNYFSIPKRFRPLKERSNIIITRDHSLKEEGAYITHSIKEAFKAQEESPKELFVIGGGEIYKQFLDLNLIDKMYITHVHHSFDADTFFPKINLNLWKIDSEILHTKDEKNEYDMALKIYTKIPN